MAGQLAWGLVMRLRSFLWLVVKGEANQASPISKILSHGRLPALIWRQTHWPAWGRPMPGQWPHAP